MTRETREARAQRLGIPRALVVELPTLPPITNHLYINLPGRGRAMSKAALAWKHGAILVIQSTAHQKGWKLAPRTPYTVVITVAHPRVFTFDLDGRLKLLLDSVAAAIGVDDRYIVDIRASKQRNTEALTVVIAPVEPEGIEL